MNTIDQSEITTSLRKNINIIKEQLNHTSELVVREIQIGEAQTFNGVLLYLDDIVNSEFIHNYIIKPLHSIKNLTKTDTTHFISNLASRHVRSPSVEIVTSFDKALNGIVKGRTLILFDGYDTGILAETTEWQKRSIEQSSRQRSPAGPMIGLSEQLKVNLNLIRSSIQTPNLCVEMKQIGRLSNTDLSIIYLKDKVDKIALEEVRTRIDRLDVEYVLELQVVDDALEGSKRTIFPLVLATEMPDIVASALYEGRIAVMVNGTPQASIVPSLFVNFMTEPLEYYSKVGRLSNRLILFFCYFMTVFLPGIYLAIIHFHDKWFPAKFAKKFFEEKETILPLFAEVMLLVFLLYLMGLASYRISADLIVVASLVGTMVISTTAVDAKLVHPLSLIIVGTSYLTSLLFLTGGLGSSIFSLRYLFIIIGSFFGMTALGIGFVLLVIYLSRLRSVGVPYLAPIIPFRPHEFKDVFYRGDLKKLINSPHKYPHDDNE